MINEIKKKKNLFSILMAIMPFAFFIFFACYDQVVICADSIGYIKGSEIREPLYPFIIMVSKFIFGTADDLYLLCVVFVQSLLMAYATYKFVSYITDVFDLESLYEFAILFLILSISLMCRFLAKRGSMYSNSILTEGIAYPLFILFIRYDFEYLITGNKKPLVLSTIISFLLISTRKQMYISLVLLIMSVLYVSIIHREKYNGLVKMVLIILIIIGSYKVFDLSFTRFMYGINRTHTSDNRFLATMVFYTSEKEDSELIKNETLKKEFIAIYDECDKNGYLKHNSNKDWYGRLSHFYDNYDYIQIDTMWPMLRDYVKTNFDDVNETNLESYVDLCNEEIIKSLLPNVWPKIAATFFDNLLGGFIITVSADNPKFIIYSILIYIVYLTMLVYLLIKEKNSQEVLFSLLTMSSTVINVLVVSLVIFNQTRYTIYNMALFYISLILMFRRILQINMNKKYVHV